MSFGSCRQTSRTRPAINVPIGSQQPCTVSVFSGSTTAGSRNATLGNGGFLNSTAASCGGALSEIPARGHKKWAHEYLGHV